MAARSNLCVQSEHSNILCLHEGERPEHQRQWYALVRFPPENWQPEIESVGTGEECFPKIRPLPEIEGSVKLRFVTERGSAWEIARGQLLWIPDEVFSILVERVPMHSRFLRLRFQSMSVDCKVWFDP